ncbi:MAG: DNA polymerase III subunit delta [Alistipes sp.]|jgi:DNA polymerase-3 subunit delta'|nr:DNA polymerase III subunit delta [Alistipes sp.]
MRFSDIKGQEEIKRRLVRTIDTGRVSHAQMFTGEAGSGTLPLALAYIQYLNCPDRKKGDSCGVCPSCKKIASLAHPDIHFVMPVNKQGKKSGETITSDTFLPEWRRMVAETGGYFDEQMWYDALGLENLQGLISKKEADEVIHKLGFKSFEGGYKCVLMWLPEKMNTEAANTLLKILEEPWAGTLFLLVSARPGLLPATILSRVQETVVPGGEFEVRRQLRGADTAEASEEFEAFVELMRLSYNDKHLELMKWAERVASLGRERQKRMLENFIRLLRSSLMINAGLEDIAYLWGAELDFCRKFAPFIGAHNVEKLVEEMESALGQMRQNASATIVFTHFALAVSKLITKN